MMKKLLVLAAVALLLGSSPASAGLPDPRVTGTLATGLEIPWGVAPLPSGETLVSELLSARILSIKPSGKVDVVGQLPGALYGIAVSPRFRVDHYVYASFTGATDSRIVRMRYADGRLGAAEPLLTGIPRSPAHNGGRIAFGPDGMLYAGTGDGQVAESAQDPHDLRGKILRMTPTGQPAPGNPYPGSVVYSIGHRNVEGLAWDSCGRLWASELGDNQWDELNLIVAGRNYGWPVVEGKGGDPRFVDPVWQWRPADASPSGVAIVDDVIYVASLRGKRLWRAPINGSGVATPAAFFVEQFGRLRTVIAAPGGGLWLTTSNRDPNGTPMPSDDRILRVTVRG
jgi:glucose/arabinose dehydrogenase